MHGGNMKKAFICISLKKIMHYLKKECIKIARGVICGKQG
jgi:hypothetical protein